MVQIGVGKKFRGKEIKDIIKLSNGWYLIKTENSKSAQDFKVKAIFSLKPLRSLTPKHAHFAIDFYGKLCADREKAMKVFNAIIDVWNGKPVEEVLQKYLDDVKDLPGYNLEYILYALKWILEQEDINFNGRPPEKQKQLDEILGLYQITVPKGREGSELAISLFCEIAKGVHPVEAFIKANLDVIPRKRGR